MEPILEVQNLSKTFREEGGREIPAVRDVSFSLLPGETLGIVGESGSGKSTLARLICRLTEPSAGSIRLGGRELVGAKGKALRAAYRDLQMVFQAPMASFDPRRTVGDSVGESLRNQGWSRKETAERVQALLEQCGLPPEFADRCPRALSGGQCQRAAIARALAPSPRVLICDEATSALDVTVQRQILDLLGELRGANGLSYLFICHNLALVQSFCDRVLVMHRGQVVEEGTPDQVILTPKSPYTQQLVASVL